MPLLRHATDAPVADNQNILTAGPRGPALLQDIWRHTRASLFPAEGKRTARVARISTMAGEPGAADAERDSHGFAVKFDTGEGHRDRVGNKTPVFFMRDPLRHPDLKHAGMRNPRSKLRSTQNNGDFWTLVPEALHQVTCVLGDRGLPASDRHMHGFGSHSSSLLDAGNRRHKAKFTVKSQPGIRNLGDAEAAAVDDFSQPGALFRLMVPDEQQRLFENTARPLGNASQGVKDRHIANGRRAAPACGDGVARAIAALQGA